MSIYAKEEQLKLIQEDWKNLKIIENQYEEVCLEAVKQKGWALEYVKDQTKEICLEAIKQNGLALEYVKDQTKEICLEAVKQDGWALEYVKDQTFEICLEAVKQNGWVLEHVKEQTPEICLAAINEDGESLKYVKKQTEEICLAAIKQNGINIKKVKNKTSKLCFYAFLNDYNLLEIEYMQKGIDEFINNQFIENNVFSISKFIKKNKNFYTLDIQSLTYLKDYLLKQKNNKYILNDSVDIEILKEIALSNNELILVDEGNINNIHKKLANRIIKEEDLKKESF